MGIEILDIRDKILRMDVENITNNNYRVLLQGPLIVVDDCQVFFYNTREEAEHDFNILERYVRLQNCDF
jgi:hypothetical protein